MDDQLWPLFVDQIVNRLAVANVELVMDEAIRLAL